ncbi:Mob1/phocein [Rozella allomycis CSF55]|uniref:Mob1/phocein n=1 Tax=Rozella allomycis (strain CSF55) TaxID=988480 RepID=A0A4P9YQU9_ROZAC|nr:Mob1/phocein [Rozella allomycis CSF55]
MDQLKSKIGTTLEDLYKCDDKSGTTNLQPHQYIKLRIQSDPSNISDIIELPEKYNAMDWIYEQLRQICIELTNLLVMLQEECSSQTCPVMKINDWLYLCASHPIPKECSALDYVVHTVDQAVSTLISSKIFPKRSGLDPNVKPHLENISRRILRIFRHAWSNHREIFVQFESQYFLYERLFELNKKYGIEQGQEVIPPGYKELMYGE